MRCLFERLSISDFAGKWPIKWKLSKTSSDLPDNRIHRRDTELRFVAKFGENRQLQSCRKVVWITIHTKNFYSSQPPFCPKWADRALNSLNVVTFWPVHVSVEFIFQEDDDTGHAIKLNSFHQICARQTALTSFQLNAKFVARCSSESVKQKSRMWTIWSSEIPVWNCCYFSGNWRLLHCNLLGLLRPTVRGYLKLIILVSSSTALGRGYNRSHIGLLHPWPNWVQEETTWVSLFYMCYWAMGLNSDKTSKVSYINICSFSTRFYFFSWHSDIESSEFHQNCGYFWSLHSIKPERSPCR